MKPTSEIFREAAEKLKETDNHFIIKRRKLDIYLKILK